VLDQLVEWWQDLSRQEINSRAVLLPVPPRWGRTYLLDQFTAAVEEDEALSIVVRVRGASLPDGLGLQALALRDVFSEARVEHRLAELLGVDRLGGVIQLGLGATGLFVAPLATLLIGVAVGAAGRGWDKKPAGQEGMVAKLARAVAAMSVSVPVVATIDDADRLKTDLAVVLVENLIERTDGQVLVAAAVNPGGDLMSALTSRATYGLTEGRIRTVDAGPYMGYQARVDLAAELCPDLPAAAIRRIGQRTQAFAEVFAIAAEERLAELDAHSDDAAAVTVVNEVIDAQVNRAPPFRLAVALAWAGGVLHSHQAKRAVDVLEGQRDSDSDDWAGGVLHARQAKRAVGLREGQSGSDGDVLHFESLVRLADDPTSPRLAGQVRILAASKRHRLAQVVLGTAVDIGADHRAGLVEKVVAWQAAHRVRADLQDRAPLIGMQCQLVHGLEDLGDLAAAYQVAETALREYPASQPGGQQTPERDDLSAAVLRLWRTQQSGHADPLIDATVAAVAAGGAVVGLEARIWAAIDLLDQPGQRERALELTDQITAELSGRNDLGAVGNRWRLLLAFHVGRAGYPTITQQLLAPILGASGPPENQDAARAVLYAVGGRRADTRLQIIGLEAELAALPPDADDDRLRVHHALAADYGYLGDYRRALHHAQQELPLRSRIQGDDHRKTLSTRADIPVLTGRCGHLAEALRLSQELLPDQERVLGRDHPDTLNTRTNIAAFTGECGDRAEGMRLYREALPDQERVLGRDHPRTLNTRNNIAAYTGQHGHLAEALRLFQELLPDQERVLGRDHPDTLTTRNNIAAFTGERGLPAEALRLSKELLPDLEHVLGLDHPNTLGTRQGIAFWTGECGHLAEALRLFQELLPDLERAVGPNHPYTLGARHAIQRLSAPDTPPDR
jgi:hypothetical protein